MTSSQDLIEVFKSEAKCSAEHQDLVEHFEDGSMSACLRDSEVIFFLPRQSSSNIMFFPNIYTDKKDF